MFSEDHDRRLIDVVEFSENAKLNRISGFANNQIVSSKVVHIFSISFPFAEAIYFRLIS